MSGDAGPSRERIDDLIMDDPTSRDTDAEECADSGSEEEWAAAEGAGRKRKLSAVEGCGRGPAKAERPAPPKEFVVALPYVYEYENDPPEQLHSSRGSLIVRLETLRETWRGAVEALDAAPDTARRRRRREPPPAFSDAERSI